ncbi:hypothetical protein L1887_29039 [Cichorium endivia]|nr:hypothetical protein L1887_29039 [Cichorium endivia]
MFEGVGGVKAGGGMDGVKGVDDNITMAPPGIDSHGGSYPTSMDFRCMVNVVEGRDLKCMVNVVEGRDFIRCSVSTYISLYNNFLSYGCYVVLSYKFTRTQILQRSQDTCGARLSGWLWPSFGPEDFQGVAPPMVIR